MLLALCESIKKKDFTLRLGLRTAITELLADGRCPWQEG